MGSVSSGDASFFNVGSDVEVTRGHALIPAKIIARGSSVTSFVVEYKTLRRNTSDEKKKGKPMREELDVSLLRPSPPKESDSDFELEQEVDAYYNGRWWEGVITRVLDEEGFSKYSVYVGNREMEFESSRLRPHGEWVRGNWVPPLPQKNVSVSDGAKAKEKFEEGSLVEVQIKEEGFEGSWYAAKIIQDVGEDKYLVQYRSIRTDTGEKFLKEEVDRRNIRPYPPETIIVDSFNLNEEVDALYNDGWWEGKISKVLKRGRYRVYFENTDEEMVFEHSDLRQRQNWINGTWVMAFQPRKHKIPKHM